MNTKDIIEHLLWSFFFNRDTDRMEAICSEVLRRIDKMPFESTDDGDIIYGFMIECFGNFGTSPRSGWFEDDEEKKNCIEALNEFKGFLKMHRKMWGEEDETGND